LGKRDPVLEGSAQREFSDTGFLHRYVYFGSAYFIGQEVVYYKDTPFCTLSYSSGLTGPSTDNGKVYAFLKEALLLPDPRFPVRGPHRYQSCGMHYENLANGGIERFYGSEQIMEDQRVIRPLLGWRADKAMTSILRHAPDKMFY